MKRILTLLLSVVIIFCLCGCSAEKKGVPDVIVEDVISNEFGRRAGEVEIYHSVDTSTHIDNVSVDVRVANESENRIYSYDLYAGSGDYRYNKANDTWDLYNDFDWDRVATEYNPSGYIREYEGLDYWGNVWYTVNITDIDFVNEEITGDFYVTDSILYLSGQQEKITLNTSGTYDLDMEYDGFRLTIIDDEFRYTFSFSKY